MNDEKLKQDRLLEEKRKAREAKRQIRALQVKRDQAKELVDKECDINNDKFPCRLDILYGYKTIRAELAARILSN